MKLTAAAYRESYFFKKLTATLESSQHSKRGNRSGAIRGQGAEGSEIDHNANKDGGSVNSLAFFNEQPVRALFYRQLYILLMRSLMIARRDYGLYYTQCMTIHIFSFLIGAIMMNTQFTISAILLNLYGGTSLMIFILCNVHIFKVS